MHYLTNSLQHFFQRIMTAALVEHGEKVSIGDRNITNLHGYSS